MPSWTNAAGVGAGASFAFDGVTFDSGTITPTLNGSGITTTVALWLWLMSETEIAPLANDYVILTADARFAEASQNTENGINRQVVLVPTEDYGGIQVASIGAYNSGQSDVNYRLGVLLPSGAIAVSGVRTAPGQITP